MNKLWNAGVDLLSGVAVVLALLLMTGNLEQEYSDAEVEKAVVPTKSESFGAIPVSSCNRLLRDNLQVCVSPLVPSEPSDLVSRSPFQ